MNTQGVVKPGYEAVRDAFQDDFNNGGEVGAAWCVYVNGEVAVDLWGSAADPATGLAWEADTPALLASSTKGLTAICMHRLGSEEHSISIVRSRTTGPSLQPKARVRSPYDGH